MTKNKQKRRIEVKYGFKVGIDKFGLNLEDINDLYDEDKAAATGDAPVAAAVQTEG